MKRVFFLILAIGQCLSGFCSPEASSPEIEVEGIVLRVSKLLDPRKSDYPNCYYMVEFEVKRVLSGKINSPLVNLSVPGFMNYKLTSFVLKKGEMIRCGIVSENSATEKERETQVCDDFNFYDRETFFLRSYQVIDAWTGDQDAQFNQTQKYQSAWNECFNPPKSAKSIAMRAAAIRDELKLLTTYTDQVDINELQKRWDKDSLSLPQIKPGYFWFQKGDGVYALPKNIKYYAEGKLTDYEKKQTIPAIIALNEYLKKQYVDLIIVLYPNLYSIALRAFYGETISMPIQPSNSIAQILLENDVEVIDLAPRLLSLLEAPDFLFYYYHLNDHPGWATQDLAGKFVAERLQRYDIPPKLDPSLFLEKRVIAFNEKYIYPENLPIGTGKAGSPVMTDATFYNNTWTRSDPQSPICLWGNSFLDWPKNAAFCTAVAKYHLNFCERRHGAGCFTSMIRNCLISPQNYIQGKKAIIMPISVDMFRDRKFWNIESMDTQLQRQNNFIRSIPIPLPDGDKISDYLEKKTKENNLSGKFYLLGSKPLRIAIPNIEANQNISYVNIQFYNNYSMKIIMGDFVQSFATPAEFIIETIDIPYVKDWKERKKEIIFAPEGRDRQLFITQIEIREYKNE